MSPDVPVWGRCSSLFKHQGEKEVDETPPYFIQAFIYLFTTTFQRVAVLEAHGGLDPRYSHPTHSGSHYVHTACTPVLENLGQWVALCYVYFVFVLFSSNKTKENTAGLRRSGHLFQVIASASSSRFQHRNEFGSFGERNKSVNPGRWSQNIQ